MIKVLIVDDSALIRSMLQKILNSEPDIEVVATAQDAFVAREHVKKLKPDVITLDIEMPKVDGITFLDRLMKAAPTPVVMISTLTEAGADATITALSLGAVDFVPKPKVDVAKGLQSFASLIVSKVRMAAGVKVKKLTAGKERQPLASLNYRGTELIVGIGASTGGTEAIKNIVTLLPASFPAIIITQHIPPQFTTSFAKRLDGLSAMTVSEAKDGERLLLGHAYLAPGDRHLMIQKSGADYRIRLDDGEKVTGHKPSVDEMFESLAKQVKENTIACLLTGMGKDGAQGMHSIKQAGGYTITQNEATCVVYGMPKEADRLEAQCESLPINDIAQRMITLVNNKGKGNRI
ncbi:chemotaxis response regulator protein-glutamate methylesterase [Alteromonas ponticola]|nr:chemotaxis response regulator protein-glutamate methylesterase [Alteromonas sp. ASW11-130]MCW8092986.1 chemotaxis response regulator protein-glutamate methylesterase [Alteromonas sp. ASW11-130]